MGWFSSPKKCIFHGKYEPCAKCQRNPRKNTKRKEERTIQRKGKPVKTSVWVNTGTKTDTRGNQWCSKCSCRVMNGKCTNWLCGKKY